MFLSTDPTVLQRYPTSYYRELVLISVNYTGYNKGLTQYKAAPYVLKSYHAVKKEWLPGRSVTFTYCTSMVDFIDSWIAQSFRYLSRGWELPLCPLGEERACVATDKLHSPRVPPEEGKGKPLLRILYLSSFSFNSMFVACLPKFMHNLPFLSEVAKYLVFDKKGWRLSHVRTRAAI